MAKIKDVMNTEVVTVNKGDTIEKVIEVMAEKRRGLVVVINNEIEKKPIGVVSNDDIIRKVDYKKLNPSTTFVDRIMTREVISIREDETTSDAMILMQKYGVKRLPVMNSKGILVGIISSNDIIKSVIKAKKELLDMAIDF